MNLRSVDRPLLMAILNVTPDSFSNDGEHFHTRIAVGHAVSMLEEGADIIDIGGESTRPGAGRVTPEMQIERVVPVLEELQGQLPADCPVSIDTTSSRVAEAAFAAGASIINDVSAGREDHEMFAFAASVEAPLILMHMQGEPSTMQKAPRYGNVVEEIHSFLMERAQLAEAAGVERKRIFIDPGIGFGKTRQNNLDLIANLPVLTASGYGVMLGASRKRFMGSICQVEKFSDLVGATCATTALAVMAGVDIIRVHDVRENRQALDVAHALKGSVRE